MADRAPERAASHLLEAALGNGGRDNVTVLIVDVLDVTAPATGGHAASA